MKRFWIFLGKLSCAFVGVLLAAIFFLLIPGWQVGARALTGDIAGAVLLFGTWFFWVLLAFVVHEGGHLFHGVRMNMSPTELVLGILRLRRGTQGWDREWKIDWKDPLFFVKFAPFPGTFWKRRKMVLLLGGPLWNFTAFLLIHLLSYLLFRFSPLGPTSSQIQRLGDYPPWVMLVWFPLNLLFGFLNQGAFVNLYLALATLVPGKTRGNWKTDGLQILELWQSPEEE